MNQPPCNFSWRAGGIIIVVLEIVCSIYSLWMISMVLSLEDTPNKCPSDCPITNNTNNTSNNSQNFNGTDEEFVNITNNNITESTEKFNETLINDNSTLLYPAHTRTSKFYNYVSFVLHSGNMIFAILLTIGLKKNSIPLMTVWIAYKFINCIFSLIITVTSILTTEIYQCRSYQQITDSMLFILYMIFMFVIFAVIQETQEENEMNNKKSKKF